MSTPAAYEELVGAHYRKLGYESTVTQYTADYGLDVLATNAHERVAIQAKLYGGTSRKVNRQMMMELFGVAAYFDCDRAVMATNGQVLPDAIEVAAKLRIEVLRLETNGMICQAGSDAQATVNQSEQLAVRAEDSETSRDATGSPEYSFDQIWQDFIMPLAGATLRRTSGVSNQILAVDWSGITRSSSNGKVSRIEIEIFRRAIRQLLTSGAITREEINDNYAKRASSGVVLVLSQVPVFSLETKPKLRLVFTPGVG